MVKYLKQKEKYKFRDMSAKKSFSTDTYRVTKKGKTCFAVAETPSGNEAWRIISKDDYSKAKK